MSETSGARLWVPRAGLLIGVATLSGLGWWATGELNVLAFCCMGIACFDSMFAAWKVRRRGKPPWRPRWPRFSIGQIMAASVVVAVYLGMLRALFTAFPVQDWDIVLLLSAVGLLFYGMYCFFAYRVWVSVRNVRAVLRGDLRYRNFRSQSFGRGDDRGDGPCVDDPGSRSAGP